MTSFEGNVFLNEDKMKVFNLSDEKLHKENKTTTTSDHLTMRFQCDRLREFSCHSLITCFHSERDIASVKTKTCELNQGKYIIILFFFLHRRLNNFSDVPPVSVCSSSRIPSTTIQG